MDPVQDSALTLLRDARPFLRWHWIGAWYVVYIFWNWCFFSRYANCLFHFHHQKCRLSYWVLIKRWIKPLVLSPEKYDIHDFPKIFRIWIHLATGKLTTVLQTILKWAVTHRRQQCFWITDGSLSSFDRLVPDHRVIPEGLKITAAEFSHIICLFRLPCPVDQWTFKVFQEIYKWFTFTRCPNMFGTGVDCL